MQENTKVAKAAVLMAGAAVVCRLVSFGKELYVAWFFGAGAAIDALALAIMVPALGAALFLNSVRRAYLTQYATVGAEGSPERAELTDVFLTSLSLVSLGFVLVLSLAIRPVFRHVIPDDNPEVIRHLVQLAVPAAWLLVPTAVITGLLAVLQAKGRFAVPQFTHLLPTLAIVGAVLLYGRQWGPNALIWGLLAGSAVQCVVLFGAVRKAGHVCRPAILSRPHALRDLWALSLPIILLEFLVQANVYVDRAMAATLDSGRVSSLYWSAMMKDFISGTFIASLLTVLLPHFSAQAAAGATDELRRSCSLVVRYGAITMLPVSVLLAVCGPPVFRYAKLGNLTPEAATSVSWCLAAYGLGLWAEMVSGAFANALMALKRIRALVIIGVFAYFLPNIAFNLLLIGPLGEVGLALSTSLVSFTTMAFLSWRLSLSVGGIDGRRNLRVSAGICGAAGAMAAVGWLTLKGFEAVWPGGGLSHLLASCSAGVLGLAVYALLLIVYPGCEDARHAWRICRDKLKLSLRQGLTALKSGTASA